MVALDATGSALFAIVDLPRCNIEAPSTEQEKTRGV
jgi:hypothetical protein